MSDKTIMIDSRGYPDQNPNDLTVYLDEAISGVQGMKVIYAGIPCTFYNISQEIGNNNFLISDGINWRYLNIPDGLYDINTFDRQFGVQLKTMGLHQRGLRFDIDETNGKMVISFRKQKGNIYKLTVRSYNKDLFGFSIPRNTTGLLLPRSGEIAISEKPANFKPFEFFHIHCDIISSENMLYNGKKSDLLVKVPVKECDFGATNNYYLTGLRDRKCLETFNKLRIWITDEYDKPINFNDGNIQYELRFT